MRQTLGHRAITLIATQILSLSAHQFMKDNDNRRIGSEKWKFARWWKYKMFCGCGGNCCDDDDSASDKNYSSKSSKMYFFNKNRRMISKRYIDSILSTIDCRVSGVSIFEHLTIEWWLESPLQCPLGLIKILSRWDQHNRACDECVTDSARLYN